MDRIKMKYLFVFLSLVISRTTFSQFFSSKVDLNISYVKCFSVGKNHFESNSMGYSFNEPYLYPNLNQNYGYCLTLLYNYPKMSYGIEYSSNIFTNKSKDSTFTKFDDISMKINSYRFVFGKEILKHKKIINQNTKIYVFLKPQISLIKYKNGLNSYTISNISGMKSSVAPDNIIVTDVLLNENIFSPGFAISTKLSTQFKQSIGVFFEYEADLLFVQSKIYSDKFFFTNSLKLGVAIILSKNKMFY